MIQMNGDLDMSLEQIMDVNGNGTGKSKKWFEQKIAELEELEKTSVVAVDGGSSGSERMTDLDSLAPGLEMIDFAEKYFNVHAQASGYTRSAISKTVSMVRRRSLSVSILCILMCLKPWPKIKRIVHSAVADLLPKIQHCLFPPCRFFRGLRSLVLRPCLHHFADRPLFTTKYLPTN